MKFSNKYYQYIAYGSLLLLCFIVICMCFNYKYSPLNSKDEIYFSNKVNQNSNATLREGFTEKPDTKLSDIFTVIDNKLNGLTTELGGSKGQKETKQILVKTKKICNLECAKCMMNMIEENKSLKTVDLDSMLDDETSDNCIKCKKYTELSTSIQSIIDNL